MAQVSSMKGRVNTPTPKAKEFNPNTINESVNPWAWGIKAQTTSYSWKSSQGDKLPVIEETPLKDPFGNYNPLTPQQSIPNTPITWAGSTSVDSWTNNVNKQSIAIPKVKITKDIVDWANARRSQIGLTPVKAKDLPIPQDWSTVAKINSSIDRWEYNTAFALSASNAVNEVVWGWVKNILHWAWVAFWFVGKNYAEYGVANPALAIQWTYLIAKNNLEKFIDDTKDAPYKIIDNLKKQSLGQIVWSEGKSLLKWTYDSSYGIGNNLDWFEDAKNRVDYLFWVKSWSQEDLWQTRSETRDELRNANPMDTSNKATYDELDKYTMLVDVAMDLISTVGITSWASSVTRLTSIANEGSVIAPLFAPVAITIESLVNPSLSWMMRVGWAVAVWDTLSYSLTWKRLWAWDKASEEAVNALEFGWAIWATFKWVGYVAPKVAKLVTDNMPSFDSMVKSSAIKELINTSESVKKEFMKGYEYAQNRIMSSMEDARGQRGSIKIWDEKDTIINNIDFIPKKNINPKNPIESKKYLDINEITREAKITNPEATAEQLDELAKETQRQRSSQLKEELKNRSWFREKLKEEWYIKEGDDSIGWYAKWILEYVSTKWNIANKDAWIQRVSKMAWKEVLDTPDIDMRATNFQAKDMMTKWRDIMKPFDYVDEGWVKRTAENFWDYVIARRQYELALINPKRVVWDMKSGDIIKRYKTLYQQYDTLFSPQLKQLKELNDTALAHLKNSWIISSESKEKMEGIDVYVISKFLDEWDHLFAGRSVGTNSLKSIWEGSEREMSYYVMKNQSEYYARVVLNSNRNRMAVRLANDIRDWWVPWFSLSDEITSPNYISFFDDWVKKYINGTKDVIDYMKKEMKLVPTSQLHSLVRPFAEVSRIAKMGITGVMAPFKQPAQIIVEMVNAWLDSIAKNKWAFAPEEVFYWATRILKEGANKLWANFKLTENEEANKYLMALMRHTWVDWVQLFKNEFSSKIWLDLSDLIDSELLKKKVDWLSPEEITKSILSFPKKWISLYMRWLNHFFWEAELHTSRISVFSWYIQNTIWKGEMVKIAKTFLNDDWILNTERFRQALLEQGTDSSIASSRTVDTWNFTKAVDEVQKLNKVVMYLTSSLTEGTRKTVMPISKIYYWAGKAAMWDKSRLTQLYAAWWITTWLMSLAYYLNEVNSTPENIEARKYDGSPWELWIYYGTTKKPDGSIVANKIAINALPDSLVWITNAWQAIFASWENVPNWKRILWQMVANKLMLAKFNWTWFSWNLQSVPLLDIISQISIPDVSIGKKNSSAWLLVANMTNNMFTWPEVDNIIKDVFQSRANDVKNLITWFAEKNWVDIEWVTKWSVDLYQVTDMDKYLAEGWFTKFMWDMMRISKKELSSYSEEETSLISDVNKANLDKSQESQKINMSVDKKIAWWKDKSIEEKRNIISEVTSLMWWSREEASKKIKSRLWVSSNTSMENRIESLSSENYFDLILKKLPKEERRQRLMDDYKNWLVSDTKAKSIVKISKEYDKSIDAK